MTTITEFATDQGHLEFQCGGGVRLRKSPPGGMKKGDVVLGHQHHFAHPTFVTDGALELAKLQVTKKDALGRPLQAEVVDRIVLRASDDINWALVEAGTFHMLTALEDGTRYQCIFAERLPTALTSHEHGQAIEPPETFVDADGVRWYRAVEGIVDTSEWREASL